MGSGLWVRFLRAQGTGRGWKEPGKGWERDRMPGIGTRRRGTATIGMIGCIAFDCASTGGVCGSVSCRAPWLLMVHARGCAGRTLWIQKQSCGRRNLRSLSFPCTLRLLHTNEQSCGKKKFEEPVIPMHFEVIAHERTERLKGRDGPSPVPERPWDPGIASPPRGGGLSGWNMVDLSAVPAWALKMRLGRFWEK